MKTKKGLIAIILIAFTLVAAVTAIFFVQEETDSLINTGEPVTEVSSKIETEEVVVEKVESETVSSEEEKFIEPDETKADEILKNHSSKTESSVSSKHKEEKKLNSETKKEESKTSSKSSSSKKVDTSSKKTESKSKDEDTQTLEEGQKELEDTASDYLKKHNIDLKTAGETGELCPNCNKKIWNPDKYGFFIPGMPEDYENSGYCLGTCAIVLE